MTVEQARGIVYERYPHFKPTSRNEDIQFLAMAHSIIERRKKEKQIPYQTKLFSTSKKEKQLSLFNDPLIISAGTISQT